MLFPLNVPTGCRYEISGRQMPLMQSILAIGGSNKNPQKGVFSFSRKHEPHQQSAAVGNNDVVSLFVVRAGNLASKQLVGPISPTSP
jgi:hypothetical protein